MRFGIKSTATASTTRSSDFPGNGLIRIAFESDLAAKPNETIYHFGILRQLLASQFTNKKTFQRDPAEGIECAACLWAGSNLMSSSLLLFI